MQRFVAWILAGGVLLGAVSAFAEAEGVIEMHVDVPAPATLQGSLRDKTRKEIADRVLTRMKARLEAADVKFSNVRHNKPSGIKIEASAAIGHRLLRGILLAPGEFAIRPIQRIGRHWQSKSGDLPASVELRQSKGSLDPFDAYLWSSERRALEDFVDEVSIEGVDVLVYSTGSGWRTYAVGKPILTDDDVQGAEIRRVATGSPFVSLEIGADGQKNFQNQTRQLPGDLAAVLDEEIVGTIDASALNEGRLNLTPPQQLHGEEALMDWARQVAGRLAAAIPVELEASQHGPTSKE